MLDGPVATIEAGEALIVGDIQIQEDVDFARRGNTYYTWKYANEFFEVVFRWVT